ncbi:MAG: hypothetical protein IJW82_06705 [Clostridia bacterium]|nr:hypothetical protein [Clostridia bacterium]
MKKQKRIMDILSFLIIILVIVLLLVNINSTVVSSKNAMIMWFNNVVPNMFPFMFFTSLLSFGNSFSFLINTIGKVFYKLFKAPLISGYIYLMSLLCGYPTGANLVGIFINKGMITQKQGNKILSFCSQSGPVFIVGTVGVCFNKSVKIGFIILSIHLISSIICGLIFRNFMIEKQNCISVNFVQNSDNVLYESMNKAVNNVFIVGWFIIIFYIFIDLVLSLKFTSELFCNLGNLLSLSPESIKAIFIAFMEITSGMKALSMTNLNSDILIILSSTLISFGGVSILTQTFAMSNIKKGTYLLTKLTHTFLTLILAIFYTKIF